MDIVLTLVIGSIVSWVVLMIVIPIARKIADFGMPPWPETMMKLAVVALVANAISVVLGRVNGILALVVGAIVFWTLLYKWFQIDFFGAIVIVGLVLIVRFALLAGLLVVLQQLMS